MYQAPRGTDDILPEDQPYWRYIDSVAAATCALYGYERIDTPMFEDARLFVRGIGQGTDIVEKEMYTFKDRSGDDLTLRPEGTASVCRAYLQHGLFNAPQPVKLYYSSAIFRYERPQAGRYRQHHQFGYEAIGETDPALDAEVIDLAWQLYLALGLSHLTIQLNSIGCRQCRPAYLALLRSYYSARLDTLCHDCRTRWERNPLRLLDCKNPTCQQVGTAAPRSDAHLCPACAAHFTHLRGLLASLRLPYQTNHRLVRGLDYYTRTVFEVQPEDQRAQSTIGGGGRYDDLIEELGGRPTPAIGFATGIERIILNLKKQGITPTALPRPRVLIAHTGPALRDAAFTIAANLRRSLIPVLTSLGSRSLKSQLRQADALGLTYTLIVADEEWKNGQVIVRDMKRAEQRTVVLDEARRLIGHPQHNEK